MIIFLRKKKNEPWFLFCFKASLGSHYFCVVATHEDYARDASGPSGWNVFQSHPPAHVLHCLPAQQEVLLVPAVQRVEDLAGPLGLLVPPASTGDVLVETVVRPSAATGTRQHGIFHPQGWKNGNKMDHLHLQWASNDLLELLEMSLIRRDRTYWDGDSPSHWRGLCPWASCWGGCRRGCLSRARTSPLRRWGGGCCPLLRWSGHLTCSNVIHGVSLYIMYTLHYSTECFGVTIN